MEKIFHGRTEQEAVEKAAQEFGVSPEVIDVEIIKRSTGNIFGLQSKVTVRASVAGFPNSDTDEENEEIARNVSDYYNSDTKDESEADDNIVLTDEMESIVEDFIGTIVKSLNVHVNSIDMSSGSCIEIDIEDERDQNLLIGKFGKNIEALQTLVNAMLQNKIGSVQGFAVLNINGYREKRTAWIKDMTKKNAEHVLRSGKSYLCESFSPYDRRQIHKIIKTIDGLDTKSEGYGYLKRVRIFLS